MKFKAVKIQTGYNCRGEINKNMRLMFCSKTESSMAARFSFGTVAEVRQLFKLG